MNQQSEYKATQQKIKKEVEERVKNASEKRGVLYIVTGNGKGKSTAAFGSAVRACGHDKTVEIAQFIKGKWPTGERKVLEQLGVVFHVMETGFTWNTQDKQADTEAAQRTWASIKPALSNKEIDLVVLDELTYMLSYGYLDAEEVLETLSSRPYNQHVIVTGRNATSELLKIADTVSEIQDVKHAFRSGVKAQKGFDF